MIPSLFRTTLIDGSATGGSVEVGPQKHEHRSKIDPIYPFALQRLPSFRAFEDLSARRFVLSRTEAAAV